MGEFPNELMMKYLFYKVNKDHIYNIKYIVEGFENWMTVSTVSEEIGKIQITLPADFMAECLDILDDLSLQFTMIRVNDNPDISQGNF